MKVVQIGAITNSSRVVVSTILGLFFGVICMLLTKYSVNVAFWPIGVSFLLHHMVMGLVIGVSSLKMHWSVHGLFWGALFGVFLAIVCFLSYAKRFQDVLEHLIDAPVLNIDVSRVGVIQIETDSKQV